MEIIENNGLFCPGGYQLVTRNSGLRPLGCNLQTEHFANEREEIACRMYFGDQGIAYCILRIRANRIDEPGRDIGGITYGGDDRTSVALELISWECCPVR